MSKVWKWIIGIVIVLVVAALVVGGVFMLRSRMGGIASVVQSNRPGVQVPNGQNPFGNNGPNNNQGQRGGPGMMPGFRQFGGGGWGRGGYPMRGPGMMGFGRMMPFAGIFGGLFCLGLVALVIVGIVLLVNRNKPAQVAAPVAVVAPANPAAAEVTVAAPMVSTHSCKKCGETVQDNWKVCPYCGKKQ